MIKIIQPKRNGNNDPFFYDGIIAQGEKYYIAAVGEIEIYCSEHEELCYDCKPRNCCCLAEPETDKDIAFGSDMDEPFWFNHNNWFEILGIDQNDDPGYNAYFDYEEALDALKELENELND
jgi:hypothetical protein